MSGYGACPFTGFVRPKSNFVAQPVEFLNGVQHEVVCLQQKNYPLM